MRGLVPVGATVALAIWALWASSPIDPAAWAPSPEGAWRVRELAGVVRHELGDATGGEDVARLSGGDLVTGVQDGRLLRSVDGVWRSWVDTGGRPLGLAPSSAGGVWVADAERGLLHVDAAGHLSVRVTHADGAPMRLVDDVDEAPDGTLWLSDASTRFGLEDWRLDLLEARCTGRLVSVAPGASEGVVRLTGLCFANGVGVLPDAVLVAETGAYRVRRLWVAGPRAGSTDVFVEALPGFPDGVSVGADGRVWVALASSRRAIVDVLAPWPAARAMVAALPARWQPAPAKVLRVAELGQDGSPVTLWTSPEPAPLHTVTSAEVMGDELLLGSLADGAIATAPLPR